MAITRDGQRQSRVQVCIDAAEVFLLTRHEAHDEVDRQLSLIHEQWSAASGTVGLTAADRQQLWGHAILHPYALEGRRRP